MYHAPSLVLLCLTSSNQSERSQSSRFLNTNLHLEMSQSKNTSAGVCASQIIRVRVLLCFVPQLPFYSVPAFACVYSSSASSGLSFLQEELAIS
jgi:hypothetical protein